MVRDRLLSSADYLDLVRRVGVSEQSLHIVELISETPAPAIGRYTPEPRIDAAAHDFVAAARGAIDSLPPGDLRVLWCRALISQAARRRTPASPPLWWTCPRRPGCGPGHALGGGGELVGPGPGRGGRPPGLGAGARLLRPGRPGHGRCRGFPARPGGQGGGVGADSQQRLRVAEAGHGRRRGFFRRSQRELVEPFVPRFFEGLPGLFTEWEAEASRAYFRNLFPWHRIEPSTRELVDGVLTRGDIGPMLRRLLVEAADDLDRAIACRRYAEEAVRPVPPPPNPRPGGTPLPGRGCPGRRVPRRVGR